MYHVVQYTNFIPSYCNVLCGTASYFNRDSVTLYHLIWFELCSFVF